MSSLPRPIKKPPTAPPDSTVPPHSLLHLSLSLTEPLTHTLTGAARSTASPGHLTIARPPVRPLTGSLTPSPRPLPLGWYAKLRRAQAAGHGRSTVDRDRGRPQTRGLGPRVFLQQNNSWKISFPSTLHLGPSSFLKSTRSPHNYRKPLRFSKIFQKIPRATL
jgi:hypothetical protein